MNPTPITEVLERLKKKRARGRLIRLEIDVRLMELKKRGMITEAQLNYVLGIELADKSKSTESPSKTSRPAAEDPSEAISGFNQGEPSG